MTNTMTNSNSKKIFQMADMRIQPSAAFSALALCILGFPKAGGSEGRLYPGVEDAISYILYGGELHGERE